MVRAVIFLSLFALLSACGQSIPTQPDAPTAKVAADQPGGSLVGTWLRVESGFRGIYVDSLIITLRDGVSDELNYHRKMILLEGWSESESACIETLDLGIDDHVDCLMETAPMKTLYRSSWGRIRIQSDNGRGHIHYDQWEEGEEEDGTRTLIQLPRITYDNRLIVWDDQLIFVIDDDLKDIFEDILLEDIQLIRSTR